MQKFLKTSSILLLVSNFLFIISTFFLGYKYYQIRNAKEDDETAEENQQDEREEIEYNGLRIKYLKDWQLGINGPTLLLSGSDLTLDPVMYADVMIWYQDGSKVSQILPKSDESCYDQAEKFEHPHFDIYKYAGHGCNPDYPIWHNHYVFYHPKWFMTIVIEAMFPGDDDPTMNPEADKFVSLIEPVEM